MSNLFARLNCWRALTGYLKGDPAIIINPGFIGISPGPIIFYSLFILITLTVLFFVLMVTFRLSYIRERNSHQRLSEFWEPIILSYLAEETTLLHTVINLNIKPGDRHFFAEFVGDYVSALAGDEYNKLIELFKGLEFTDWEIGRLKKRSVWERVFALNQLGIIKDEKALPYLRVHLKDPLPLISFAAAQSLAAMKEPNSYDDVAAVLLKGEHWNRIRAAEIFLEYGRSATAKLPKYLTDPAVPDERKALIIDVLTEFKLEEEAENLLKMAAATTDANIKTSIIKYLGQINYIEAKDFLLDCLSDPNWVIRSQGAKSLGLIGDPDVVDRLTPLLKDDIWWVRYHAAMALAEIGFEGWERLKEIKATGADQFAREICTQILSEMDLDDKAAAA